MSETNTEAPPTPPTEEQKADAIKYKNLGNAEYKAKKFDKAVGLYSKAIGLDPTNHVFYSNRSGCFLSMQRFADATNDAQKCIELKPDWHKGYIRKAQVFESKGGWGLAREAYEDGLKANPGNAALEKSLAVLKQKEEETKKSGGGLGGGGDHRVRQGVARGHGGERGGVDLGLSEELGDRAIDIDDVPDLGLGVGSGEHEHPGELRLERGVVAGVVRRDLQEVPDAGGGGDHHVVEFDSAHRVALLDRIDRRHTRGAARVRLVRAGVAGVADVVHVEVRLVRVGGAGAVVF